MSAAIPRHTPPVAASVQFPNLHPDVVAGYLNAPPHMVAEVLDGSLSLMPRPRFEHSNAAGELFGELRGPFRYGRGGPGGWIFHGEPELHLGPLPDILVPDIGGWRRERFPQTLAEKKGPAHSVVAPDWCCEVLSVGTEGRDRGPKMRIYRREGVHHVWLVDPQELTLEVFRLDAEGYTLVNTWSGNDVVHAEPFEALELPLAVLWEMT